MNTGDNRFMNGLTFASAMSCLVLLGWTASADTIYYKGPGGDLADPANWSSPSWTAADKLVVSTTDASGAAVTFPADGFSLSADLPANSALQFTKFPAKDVVFDTAGRRLNTADLRFDNFHPSDPDRKYRLVFTGGFTNVTKMTFANNKAHPAFSNGVYYIENSFKHKLWYDFLRILKDGELVVCKIVENGACGSQSDASYPEFTIDGGRLRFAGRGTPDANWAFVEWKTSGNNNLATTNMRITNGGEYRDDTTYPQDNFSASFNVRIDNGGAYIATNSVRSNRNTMWNSKGVFTVTNGSVRIAQLYLSKYVSGGDFQNETASAAVGSRLLFHNSQEIFRFAPSSSTTASGIVVSQPARANQIRFSGDDNVCDLTWFLLGGVTNRVEVAGGTFAASNSLKLLPGYGNEFLFTGGTAALGAIYGNDSATNALIRVSGSASIEDKWDSTLSGVSNRLEIAGGRFNLGAYWMQLNGRGSRMDVTGGASTGGVCFAANDSRMTVGADATHVAPLEEGWYGHDFALWFTSGKSDQVLVISNGTFECGKPFLSGMDSAADRVASSGQTGTEGVPFTNCPNSRIEFRGDHPAFVITSAKIHGTSGARWHQFALGSTVDPETGNWTRRPFKLDNPVRLRFCVPKNGYAQAPFRAMTGNGGALGGNAEFEFDMSDFEWPLERTRIPLVYNASGYYAWGGVNDNLRNINVDGLNEINAERLPVNPNTGRKARLVLEDDGKTLSLAVPGSGGMMIIFR